MEVAIIYDADRPNFCIGSNFRILVCIKKTIFGRIFTRYWGEERVKNETKSNR